MLLLQLKFGFGKKWKIVVDTNMLLSKQDRKILAWLPVCLPLAVWEEIILQSGGYVISDREIKNRPETKERIKTKDCRKYEMARGALLTIRKMLKRKKWTIVESSGTGIVFGLSSRKISDLGKEEKRNVIDILRQRRKYLDAGQTLLNLLHSTDLRVLAASLVLQRKEISGQKVILLTRDKILSCVAKDCGLLVQDSLNFGALKF